MFGCAPGGGPTTLLGGPLRSKAPQQTFPPASCPDGKPPFLPAFCQTSPAFRSRATPNLPCPTAPTFCRRAIALRPHPRLSPASHTQKPPPGRATLTPHSAALLRPRHHPNAAPAPPRPVILPESAGPTTLAPLPALHSLLLRLRRAGLAAPHPRVHALAQHAPLTLNHNSHAHVHTRLTAPQQTASALFRAVAVAVATGTGPDTKKTPAPLKVRASVLPNNRRITSRSSRHSPWRPSERPDRRCRRGSSSRPKR